MALAKTPHKSTWRMWAICCDGVGPIDGQVFVTRGNALVRKRSHFGTLNNYRIKRVKIRLDPERRASGKSES